MLDRRLDNPAFRKVARRAVVLGRIVLIGAIPLVGPSIAGANTDQSYVRQSEQFVEEPGVDPDAPLVGRLTEGIPPIYDPGDEAAGGEDLYKAQWACRAQIFVSYMTRDRQSLPGRQFTLTAFRGPTVSLKGNSSDKPDRRVEFFASAQRAKAAILEFRSNSVVDGVLPATVVKENKDTPDDIKKLNIKCNTLQRVPFENPTAQSAIDLLELVRFGLARRVS